MKQFIMILALILTMPVMAQAAEKSDRQAVIKEMRADVLSDLYKAKPGVDSEIRQAAGYAVFSNASLAAIFVSGGYGYGIAHDNRTGEETYMQMASAGVGLGLGVKDFRTVFVFHDPAALHNFVNEGLDLSGQADVAVKAGPDGGAVGGSAPFLPAGTNVYQLTDAGLMAQVMLQGTKYWRDDYLNGEDDRRSGLEQRPAYN